MTRTENLILSIENVRVGHCIAWNGEGCSVEDIEDQPDDESYWVTVCFDGARTDEGVTIPYGTDVQMLHACQFEAAMAEAEAGLRALDASIEANRQPISDECAAYEMRVAS